MTINYWWEANTGQERSTVDSEAKRETERRVNQILVEVQFVSEHIMENSETMTYDKSNREETQGKLSHLGDAERQASNWEEVMACTTPTQTRSILWGKNQGGKLTPGANDRQM